MPAPTVLPVDSEHNAIFRRWAPDRARTSAGLFSPRRAAVFAPGRLIRSKTRPPEQALRHPNWSMGRTHHRRFSQHDEQGARTDRGHSICSRSRRKRSTCWCIRNRWCMGWSNSATVRWCATRFARHAHPIAHCLAWPRRIDTPSARLNLAQVRELTFESPDPIRFRRYPWRAG